MCISTVNGNRRINRLPGHLAACAAIGALMLAASGRANAGLNTNISVNVTPQSGGMYLYSYTVSVLPTSTSAVSVLDLNLNDPSQGATSTGATVSAITEPTGFSDLYTVGDSYIEFSSSDPSTDIQPGTSGVFSFTSPSAAAAQPYHVMSYDTNEAANGNVLAPFPGAVTAAPEPSSVFLVGLGITGALRFCSRRRRVTAK